MTVLEQNQVKQYARALLEMRFSQTTKEVEVAARQYVARSHIKNSVEDASKGGDGDDSAVAVWK